MESISKSFRQMSLTPELVALCHRDVVDPGPEAKYDYFVDADYAKAVERLLKERPKGPFWLFAYGSLIWKPEFPTEESLVGVAEGWHRSFCLHLERFRGSPEQPGLMMALDTGAGFLSASRTSRLLCELAAAGTGGPHSGAGLRPLGFRRAIHPSNRVQA
jgi:hypothetical protein